MEEIRPRFNDSERKALVKALSLALKQDGGQSLSDEERSLVIDIRERLQYPGAARRKQTLTQEDYPARGGMGKTDDEIALFLKKEYHAAEVEKIGTGKRMDFWCAIARWRGEQRCLLLTVNPATGYVGGLYAFPLKAMEKLGEFINQQSKRKGGS